MKVQHDTSWSSLTNDALIEKPVDELEESNQELSQSSNTLTDIWTLKDSRQKKDPQKPKKRHRFPPSLLSSRAVDFWNALMPLRANCSCSSVSLGDKCSRSSFGVSSSDATFVSNLESPVPASVQETALRETLGDTLEHSNLSFRLLIGRMVGLFNVLNEQSDSSLSHVCSDPNLKILSLSDHKLKESTDVIDRNSRGNLSSITSVSSDSSNIWSTRRTGKKSESSTTFEIAERKRRGRGLFSQKSILPNGLRITKSVLTLTSEELLYFLQYKKSLLSEYFQRKDIDPLDLEENTVVYGSQSDSGLQENDFLRFIQFLRERKQKDAEDITKINLQSLSMQRRETRFTAVCNEDTRQLSPPKRRVTFSDPITDESTTVLDCDSSDDEDRILSAQNSSIAITNDHDIESDQIIQSDSLDDSKYLKTCSANLSLDSLSPKAHDLDKGNSGISEPLIEQENGPCHVAPNPDVTDGDSEEDMEIVSVMDTSRPSLLQKGWRTGSVIDAGKIEEEMLVGLKFLVKETVDWGTTHVPKSNELFEEPSGQQNSDESLKRKIRSDQIDYEDNKLAFHLHDESIRSKITGCSNIKLSKIPVRCNKKRITWNLPDDHQSADTAVAEDRFSSPSAKSVTFQDCCKTKSDQSVISKQSEEESDSLSESNGRFKLSWKGCWDQECTPEVVLNNDKSGDNGGQLFESNPAVLNESSELKSIEMYRDPVSGLKNDVQSADDQRSKRESGNFKVSSQSTFPCSSDSSVFREPDDYPSKPCELLSEFNRGYESDSKSTEFKNRSVLHQGLKNLCEGIRNPEIWRAEVRPMAKAFCKSEWYARPDSWKIPRVGSDWLIRKLEELQSTPETDYESDYYAESEMSDFECGGEISLVKRSCSDLTAQLKNIRRFKAKRSRFHPDLFLREVWPGKKIIFNKCRCRKDTLNNKYDLRSGDHDLRHRSFRGSDRRSKHNINIFSHLRARLILDSETDDSDFTSSIQPDFYYDFNRREEHVNKIKCRRFVRPLKNVGSDEDRRLSSTGLLRLSFEKSFTPASVQCTFPTRTVGTNASANKISCPMTDVSIDTCDLCPRKPIEMTNEASELTISKDNITRQMVKKEVQERQVSPPMIRGQRVSSAIANSSARINDASNNLEKLEFADIRNQPDFGTSPSLSKPTNLRSSSDSCGINQSSCPICNVDQKPTPRYVLPACIVKGAYPGSKANEKDPWNRVMERAKAQHRYEGRNKSTSSEMKQSAKSSRAASSSTTPVHDFKRFDIKDNEICKEEVSVELVQLKLNSSQSRVCGLENFTEVGKQCQNDLE